MTAQLGTEAPAFFDALRTETPSSILLNPFKSKAHGAFSHDECVPWNPWGRYLKVRPQFIRDPLYQAGAYYSQEASSMILSQVLSQYHVPDNAICLDLCAAPGGKSLILRSLLPETAFLVSNDIHPGRVEVLSENLLKWGHPRHAVARANGSQLGQFQDQFDLILIDAPCSGEGMFRKDPKAIQEWSPGHVNSCSTRQKGIVEDILPALKADGLLVYSTCTFSPEENSYMDLHLQTFGLEPLSIQVDSSWGFQAMSEAGHSYQAYQHKVRGEGFYMSVYRKLGREIGVRKSSGKGHWDIWNGDLPWTSVSDGYEVAEWKGELYALDGQVMELLAELDKGRLLKRPGLPLGEWKGKDFIPHVGTALAPGWAKAMEVELNLEETWAYLRRETPAVAGPESGWTIMQYKGLSLGWAKWVNGRMKNHYPKEWRTRTSW